MKRVFTQTISGRYPVGMIRDWPMSTWNWIADSLHLPLDAFSKPKVEEAFDPSLQLEASRRGPGPNRPRKEEHNAVS